MESTSPGVSIRFLLVLCSSYATTCIAVSHSEKSKNSPVFMKEGMSLAKYVTGNIHPFHCYKMK